MHYEGPIELLVAVFDDEKGGSEALKKLKEAAKEKGRIGVVKAAVIGRDQQNKLHVKETHGLTGFRNGEVGGAMGGVVGLIAGPAAIASIGGATLSRLADRLRESGFPEQRLRSFGDMSLTPGTSALVAIVEFPWVAEAKQHLATRARTMLAEKLKSEIAERLEEERVSEHVGGFETRTTPR